jgi:large subunit ribosomal protein L16
MLAPKKTKHRKWQTGRKNDRLSAHPDTRGLELSFGAFGIKTTEQGRITSNQIEAARKAMNRLLGKTGRMWIRIFPDRPFTRKAAEVPMGSGKGDLEGYVAPVRPGRVLFEVDGVPLVTAKEALRKAGTKLPVKVKFVERTH